VSFCGICGGPLGSVTHVCPAMLPAANPWRPWDSPLFLQSPPGAQTWRETWDAEISRLTPEILRDPVAYRLAHVAQLAFDEYEARIKAMGDPAE
jgi:hypothetical protein